MKLAVLLVVIVVLLGATEAARKRKRSRRQKTNWFALILPGRRPRMFENFFSKPRRRSSSRPAPRVRTPPPQEIQQPVAPPPSSLQQPGPPPAGLGSPKAFDEFQAAAKGQAQAQSGGQSPGLSGNMAGGQHQALVGGQGTSQGQSSGQTQGSMPIEPSGFSPVGFGQGGSLRAQSSGFGASTAQDVGQSGLSGFGGPSSFPQQITGNNQFQGLGAGQGNGQGFGQGGDHGFGVDFGQSFAGGTDQSQSMGHFQGEGHNHGHQAAQGNSDMDALLAVRMMKRRQMEQQRSRNVLNLLAISALN